MDAAGAGALPGMDAAGGDGWLPGLRSKCRKINDLFIELADISLHIYKEFSCLSTIPQNNTYKDVLEIFSTLYSQLHEALNPALSAASNDDAFRATLSAALDVANTANNAAYDAAAGLNAIDAATASSFAISATSIIYDSMKLIELFNEFSEKCNKIENTFYNLS